MAVFAYLALGFLFVCYGSVKPSRATTTGYLPSYPLAVKNPYLSTWVPGASLTNAGEAVAQFWEGQTTNWWIVARVNGSVYSLFGNGGQQSATTHSVAYTSSHTLITETVGSVNFTLDFFSPVFPGPDDYARQSLPYSYLTVSAVDNGLPSSSIQILSAIDNSWTGQNGGSGLNLTTYGTTSYFQFYNPNASAYTQNNEQAGYGSVIFAATDGDGTSYGCGSENAVFEQFAHTGTLESAQNCSAADIASISQDFGEGGTSSRNATFAVGLDRGSQAIQYLGDDQSGYYRSQWPTVASAIQFFLQDYDSALVHSISFDTAVRTKAESVSSDYGGLYADILEASVRQTFGAIELTVPSSNLSGDISVFLKEISSDGNVNTVDVIYQTWPIFVSLNPNYIKFLFRPILDYLQTGDWPEPYVVHDLGYNYPLATGHNDGNAEYMPLFETSTLFILLYVYQKYTGDTKFAAQYTSLLQGYAEYLVWNSLYPASQLISVDAIRATANQTALAIQSAIGLNAAGIILGNQTYSQTAVSYANIIYDDALGLDGSTVEDSTHFTYNYGDDDTWNVIFASYSDVLLSLSTFPTSAWDLQSSWYEQQIQEEGIAFAGPISDTSYTGSPINWGLTDWNIEAAAVSSAEVQQAIVNTTWTFLFNGLNDIPFGTKYIVEENPQESVSAQDPVGTWIGNKARSTVGTHFAILALHQGWWWQNSTSSS